MNEYAQMNKNTVSANEQLTETELVKFEYPESTGTKVMFVGNSITLHGIKDDIGWHQSHGMAASSKENDYVHIIEREVLAIDPLASFCICQVAKWERQYKNGSEILPLYKSAREFGADIIVLRFIENCPNVNFEPEIFKSELGILVDYLNVGERARIIVTTGFWKHPGDSVLREFAKEHNYHLVELGDLGENDAMKAIGLFSHEGVANHPGDLGMKMIADRLANVLIPYVDRK